MTSVPAEPSPPLRQKASSSTKDPKLAKYFRAMAKANASDLHLKAGRAPYIRVHTEIAEVRGGPVSHEQLEEMIFELMPDRQRDEYIKTGTTDLAYELPGSDRFRINVFRQRGHLALAVRRVTREIPTFEQLHLPETMMSVAGSRNGLVLLSGPTGCGKSTTIAAMIEHINQRRPCHIVTIEDPIEYLYEDRRALINQREIGIDVESFATALRSLPREDPDVVLIGEMRDHITFQAAMQVAETGHLVFGTVHASSAWQTVVRVLDLFPPEVRPQVRQSMAFNLRAIICQMLLPSVKEGVDRVPALDIMLTNPTVRQLIMEERDQELADVIRAHEKDGMRSFTQSLLELIDNELIDPKVAYEAAPNVDELKMQMKGISAGHGGLISRG
jgi:twitching motility protein PilT